MTTQAPEPATIERDASGGPRSVMRILGLFEALSENAEGLSLADLSITLAAPKSSLLTLLRPLVAERYLSHIDSRYRLGARTFRLSANILSARRFRNLLEPYLAELAEASRETVYFAVLDKESQVATCIEVVDSPQAIRYSVPVGMTLPLYLTAAGNVLLAFQDDEWQDNYIRTAKLQKLTDKTPTRATLRRQLATVREDGAAVSLGRWTTESAAISAPVFNADGSLAGALTLAGPAERLEQDIERLEQLVRSSASAASGNAQ